MISEESSDDEVNLSTPSYEDKIKKSNRGKNLISFETSEDDDDDDVDIISSTPSYEGDTIGSSNKTNSRNDSSIKLVNQKRRIVLINSDSSSNESTEENKISNKSEYVVLSNDDDDDDDDSLDNEATSQSKGIPRQSSSFSDLFNKPFYESTPIKSPINRKSISVSNLSNNSSNRKSVLVDSSSTSSDSSSDEDETDNQEELKQSNVQQSIVYHDEVKNSTVKQDSRYNRDEYDRQVDLVNKLTSQLFQIRSTKKTINYNNLPDKGKLLIEKEMDLNNRLQEANAILKTMSIMMPVLPPPVNKNNFPTWKAIQTGLNEVQPKTFGRKGIQNYNAQKALTVDRLEHIHKTLETCPNENELATDPNGLKVELMEHQRRALKWMLWRENQKPSGGILADDMGLGKTLTMIALILKNKQENGDVINDSDMNNFKFKGGTLVVCPASLINQWSNEVKTKCKRQLLNIELYHGPNRESSSKILSQKDLIITTYTIISNEYEKNKALSRVYFRRIILDEAHQIRNHKTRCSLSVCELNGQSRWALSGTPVHNKELDMYAFLKFLRIKPFDDLSVWKLWVSNRTPSGTERLHTIISSLLLRRTKEELMAKESVFKLPEKNWKLVSIKLDEDESKIYQKMLLFSRSLFAQFLHQRAEKRQEEYDEPFNINEVNYEYNIMRNKIMHMNGCKDVSQHHILVLLLRLRQLCCHPSLISTMFHENDLGGGDDDDDDHTNKRNVFGVNLIEQLNRLNIDNENHNNNESGEVNIVGPEKVTLQEATKGFFNPSNPVFSAERLSTKFKVTIELLRDTVLNNKDKAIVVSQFTSLLKLFSQHLDNLNIQYEQLDGSVSVSKRMEIVNNLNNPKHSTSVLLLSLGAGGVGLNLVGANHLILMDLHWNPQMENQATDRIYRMGQHKPVFIYKLMATETIEERIKNLQEGKLEIANSMLTGSKAVVQNKLTLNDLRMLFEM